jgi:pyridoxine 4-dehydrogenase
MLLLPIFFEFIPLIVLSILLDIFLLRSFLSSGPLCTWPPSYRGAQIRLARLQNGEGGDAFMPDPSATFTLRGGATVRRLGFGAMRITGRGVWGFPPDEAAAVALLRHAVDKGINFIDTADSYGPAASEMLIARALHPYPAGLVIASKGGFLRPGPATWAADARPEHLRRACEGSLKRLQLDRIDLYQLHCVDHRVPIEDSVGALVRLQEQGKIGQIGVSNVSASDLARAQKTAEIVSVQNALSLRDRSSDSLVDSCAAQGLAFIAFYPLAEGRLATTGAALARVAARHHATPGQIALAWLLHRSPALLPIPGTASAAHLDENLAAVDIRLSDEDFRELAATASSRQTQWRLLSRRLSRMAVSRMRSWRYRLN